MRYAVKIRRWLQCASALAAVLILAAGVLGPDKSQAAFAVSRVLSDMELAWTIGDTPGCAGWCCTKSYLCTSNFPLDHATYKCFTCEETTLEITVCCTSANEEDECFFNGPVGCGTNLKQWRGREAGSADSCGMLMSCTKDIGTTTCGSGINQKSATGTACPK